MAGAGLPSTAFPRQVKQGVDGELSPAMTAMDQRLTTGGSVISRQTLRSRKARSRALVNTLSPATPKPVIAILIWLLAIRLSIIPA
jgi:hypothetical protein